MYNYKTAKNVMFYSKKVQFIAFFSTIRNYVLSPLESIKELAFYCIIDSGYGSLISVLYKI